MPRRNSNVAGKNVKPRVVDRKPPKLLKNKNRVVGAATTKKKQPYTNQYGSSKG